MALNEKAAWMTSSVYEMLESASSSPVLSRPRKYIRFASSMTRTMKLTALIFLGICFTFYLGLPSRVYHSRRIPARVLPARELLERPVARYLHTVPRLFHQSWSDTNLPTKFEQWSATCRAKHPYWEWVLWTDEDNLELVKKYFPWFLDTYQNLPGVINRADVARNMYMYVYGGVYADLDTECLRPSDNLFKQYNLTTSSHMFTLPPTMGALINQYTPPRSAFLGRMGMDNDFGHSIPNAWMASTPAQPFWLLAIEAVQASYVALNGTFKWPEELTGPVALRDVVNTYRDTDKYKGDKIEKHVAENPTVKKTFGSREGLHHTLHVLPHNTIYPFSWAKDGDDVRDYCEASKPQFNPNKCKQLVQTDHWPSYSITYWSHTWTTGEGHNTASVDTASTDD